MPHYIAFLRGINLGNRRLKMDDLRALFVQMKFHDVATFIASGNVIFTHRDPDARATEALIERQLAGKLGYEVDTFVRTRAEIAVIAAARPFAKAEMERETNTMHVGFLKEALTANVARQFVACGTEVDGLQISDREFYWLCRIKTNESKIWASPQMRALKLPTSSMRNLTTIRKLAEAYPVVK
jgi:uncharacterized protein (DUF1697 family)